MWLNEPSRLLPFHRKGEGNPRVIEFNCSLSFLPKSSGADRYLKSYTITNILLKPLLGSPWHKKKHKEKTVRSRTSPKHNSRDLPSISSTFFPHHFLVKNMSAPYCYNSSLSAYTTITPTFDPENPIYEDLSSYLHT